MVIVVLQFVIATLLPVAASALFYKALATDRFGSMGFWPWQIVTGITFGLIAVFGTEFGIETNGATMNVRDAAPIVAGLLFGGPAGVIAGLIGGVERWFAVLWGAGSFTQTACSVATCFAGVYAAILRYMMFDERRPTWTLAFCIGVVAEVLHLLLVLLTNLARIEQAYLVVRACVFPMVGCVGLSVGLSCAVVALLSNEKLLLPRDKRELSQIIQGGMLAVVVVAFAFSTGFTFIVQNSLATSESTELLALNIDDVSAQVREAADADLLSRARLAATRVGRSDAASVQDLLDLARSIDVTEVSVVGPDGIIVASTNTAFMGFDMATGEQSAEFLALLPGGNKIEYVQPYQAISYNQVASRKYAGARIEDGFVQVGYDTSDFRENMRGIVRDTTSHRRIGEEGGLLIIEPHGEVLSASVDLAHLLRLDSEEFVSLLRQFEPRELFVTPIAGVECYGMYDIVEGYYILAVRPAQEADFTRGVAIIANAFMMILMFAMLFAVIYFIIKRDVVDSIHHINACLGQITGGNLNVKVGVRSSEEFASLSDDINETVGTLKRYIAEAEARIDTELEYARQIQRSSLPSVFPPYPDHHDFALYANMDPAREVGGDFYDFFLLNDDHLGFLIADVSGKGIPAAMFMMRAKTAIRSFVEAGLSVDEVLDQANKHLCEGNEADMFVTAWFGIIDLATGVVTYANAGHNIPMLVHDDGSVEMTSKKRSLILGAMEEVPYRELQLSLAPGDTLFLYTDGIVEANDEQGNLFGDDRLLEVLRKYSSEDVKTLCDCVHAAVEDYAGEAEQFDDMTMLALRYLGR
jgi:serine phosphatase RsbU (regulator of sigma subunit)